MNTIEFINHLRKLDINLFLEGERLRCKAPEGTLTPALKSEISDRKAEIISFLQQANLQAKATAIAPISRTENSTFPLSFAQEGLWFLYELQPNSPFYNIPLNLHFSGQLDIAALESSLRLLIARHEILRTNFITVDGKPAQAINATRDFTLPVVDLRSLPASQRDLEYQKLASLAISHVFNLSKDSLIRAELVQLIPTENVLLLTIHHIIFDGWSVNIFIQELTTIYSALVEQGKPHLPEINLQYVDFAVWQKQWLQGEVLESQLAYWQQKLTGMPALLELPTDRPRPAVQSFRGETLFFTIESDISEALVNLSQQQGVTLFILLLTAFKVLLYRYTNQPDIVVGSPSANRQNPQIQGTIGFFVNNLVLRTDLSGNPTFLQLLQQVKKIVLEAYEHQDLPLDKIVEALHSERNLSYSPLFQIVFALEHETASNIILQDLTINTSEPGVNQTAKLDLSLSLHKTEQGLIGGFEYSTDLFNATTITRMIEHWQTLLGGIIANPQQRLSDLPILTAIEQHKLLVEWNQTQQDYPNNLCIHQLFEAQAEQTPDAIAVIFKDEQLTYRELNTKANQLAHYLQALGVKPETLVGICVERSFEMIVGILGILKAGSAYLPIDPAYPSERIAYMLDDSQLPVLLTQKQLVTSLPEHQARIVCLDADWEEISTRSEQSPITGVTPENLAYVIYTSGSTGTPKGVKVAHQGLCNLVQTQIKLFDVRPDSRVLQFASVSFDASIWEIVMALCAGGKLCLGTREELQPGPALLQLLQEQKITHANFVPSVLAALADEELPTLENIVVGGEECPPSLVERWANGRRFFNLYGPTESTVCATIAQCFKGTGTLSIGRPIDNTQVYILDRHKQPVPIGVPGELHIAGVGLSRGYLNRPDLTEEKFILNPFSNQPSSRLYKTGDLARYLPDGNIEYLGRIDNQVKIRGFRIELGEIESAISQHPSVEQTVVIATENKAGNKQLAAYIVPQPQTAPPSSDLRNFLFQKLPDYMIPATFITLETLPLTPNGKIDTKALPKPETVHQQLATTKVPPQTPTQKILATIWAEVLQIQEVGIHDNFFELGGDSILSIQIIARCHQANLQLTVKDLFQHQTIAELAQIVTPAVEITAEQGLVSGIVPLTPIQHWFLEQNLPEPHHFNQSFLFEISPDLKPELLQQVLQQLLQHHDALRLRLIPNGETWQLLNASTEESEIFSTIDLSQIAPTEQIATIESTTNQLQASLNLSKGPILRVALFHLGSHQPNRLLIIIHHLAVDGVSWRILLEDLIAAYQQLSLGETIQLPAKTTSFRDWAVRLTEYAKTQTALAELDYWLTQLNSHNSPLPVDYPTEIVENQIADTAEVTVSLSAAQTTALLKEVPSAYNTQINDVLLTALVQSFAQWTGQTSLLIDLEGHGREELFPDINLSRTVGWFTSIFPVLLKLEQAESPGKSLKSIKEQLRYIPQRRIGYGIIRYLNEDETTRQQLQQLPQAQVSFNYLGQFDQMLSAFPILGLAKESSGSPVSLQGNRSHLIEIDGFVANGELQLSWAYNTKIHQSATIERLANSFIEVLTAIISHCLSPDTFGYTPSDFPDADLTQAELDELVESLTPRTLLESIYPLSPMQEGMLFHTLYSPNSGVYFEQFVCTLSGNIQVSAFEQAWRQVVELHPVLRTFFVWRNRQYPLQVVCKSVNLPWHIYDWRSLSSGEQKERLSAFLEAEREQGFELDKAPLMCCTVIQLTDDRYQFIWSNHHLLMDGWCLPIVLKQVWAFYEAFNRGENLYLDAPPPYRNYIAWLRQQDSEAAQKFWRSQLAGFRAPTPLMVDKSVENLSQEKDIYDERDIKLPATLTEALKEFARQHHLTLNTLVQGAWALLLGRYSGESDVVFGATVSGRPPALSGVESIVGLFINTLPVRVQISPETELLPWLKQLQAQQVEREQYFYSPLVEIQGMSDVPRNQPLFNSIVVFENYPLDSSLLEGQGSVEIKNVGGFERTNYPLTLGVVPGEELSIQISYNTNRFDDDTVSRMMGHLQALLSGIVAYPSGRVDELLLLTPKEKQQLLVDWNDTTKEYPQDKCIHQLFEEQVERTPDAVAVVFEGEKLTYRELNAKANQLAHYLQTLGVKPDVLVSICVERSFDTIVGILGILKAGGAYVPLDPAYPKERLAFMLEDSSVPVLLTQQKLVEKLPPYSARVVCLDSDWEEIAFHNQENPSSPVKPENLAYVIYTSGSTGKPKGVLIEHRSLVNYTAAAIAEYQIEESDRILQFSSISFDVSAEEIYTSLTSGATLVLRTDRMLSSIDGFLQQCHNWEVTVLALPTAYWHELTAFLSQRTLALPPSLRLVILGGEKALPERL
ncbi:MULTISPECIES: amino acid adenylation domain-containing protein, partial [Aerosakkonema]|uniref:amino acid adenylation domain-containing protein n=1 Tax=Aerosakkonema TaxID=1246629 RepID=UPI0035B72BA2